MIVSRFCCDRRFGVVLAALCLSTAACDIDLARGRFYCKNGEACPPGLVCGVDFVCASQSGHCNDCAANESCGDDGSCHVRVLDGSIVEPLVDGGLRTGNNQLQCEPDALRCDSGNTPQRCTHGAWESLAACGGGTPACTNGVCGVAKVAGGLVSAGNELAGARYHLVAHGLERVERICGKTVSGADLCVVGGIQP